MDNIIQDLCNLSPRQGENEIKSANYLVDYLDSQNIPFVIQTFPTQVPIVKSASLKINNQEVSCLGSSFISGKITSPNQVHFSVHSDYISTHTYTTQPSIYISRQNASLLKESAKIEGNVEIERYSFESRNILVGNLDHPKNILFAHYDCLGSGAIDNAGGVAVLLQLLDDENLFILVGNEELSYDKPNYWGKGYRQFEYKNPQLLKNAKQIIVVDGVGLTSPLEITADPDNFFPIDNLEKYHKKIKIISSEQSEVLKCYHCAEDTPDKLNPEFLEESRHLLIKMLS